MNSCEITIEREKSWPYEQYYVGSKDKKNRRNGSGENHWSGAKSLEQYVGSFVQNAMNGQGDYSWRYKGHNGTQLTYEGRFFANQMHGYGIISYPDGRTFTGIFHKNIRWGPGIQRHVNLHADVGFWRDQQLVRLAWRPKEMSIIPNFNENKGRPFVNKQRTLLAKKCTIIGETNDALQLLKHYGADPVWASKNWHKLYSPNCTDLQSLACQVSLFERNYYKGRYLTLEEITNPETEEEFTPSELDTKASGPQDPDLITEYFYAWNNNKMMVDMMKHCYQHEKFRDSNLKLPLFKILSGPRRHLRLAGDHERYSRTLILASYLGYITNVVKLINDLDVYPDVADIQGNTPLMYATCGEHPTIIEFLVGAGADVNAFNDSCLSALGIALMRFVGAVRNLGIKQMVGSLLRDIPPQSDFVINEWLIDRDIALRTQIEGQRASKLNLAKRTSVNTKITSKTMSKRTLVQPAVRDDDYESDDSFSEEKRMYTNLRREYDIKTTKTFSESPISAVPYVFTVENLTNNIDAVINALVQKNEKSKDPKKANPAKEIKSSKSEANKPASVMEISEGPIKLMDTITQLLESGADPRLVVFPQPALFMATMSCSPALVKLLLEHGADINETFSAAMDYTALDIAMSRQVTPNIVKIVKLLLDKGADAAHRLPYPDEPGPTLLHAILCKPHVTLQDEELCEELFMLLLEHCDPFVQFKGVSAAELTITNNIKLLNCLCKVPTIDLNITINSDNQTILVHIFSWTIFKEIILSDITPKSLIKNLVFNGANPLLPCLDIQEEYLSIFEYVKTILAVIDPNLTEEIKSGSSSETVDRETQKPNLRPISPLKKTELPPQSLIIVYRDAIDVLIEQTRVIHARYLQANMVKSLASVIYKFKHRRWHMIFKEFNDLNLMACGIWLTPRRCLDIWNILAKTSANIYQDRATLKHLIAIILFHNYENDKNMPNAPKYNIITSLNGHKRRKIDRDTNVLVNDYENNYQKPKEVIKFYKNVYIKPELATKSDATYFDICFNCCMPLELYKHRTICKLCKAATFCSSACMMSSIEDSTSHPCTKFLKEQATLDLATMYEEHET